MTMTSVPETWRSLRPIKGDRATLTQDLHNALISDCMLYKQGEDGGREGAARALAHMIYYLNKIGIPNPVIEPLMALGLAISDLNNGTVHDLLKPTRRGRGRPPRARLDDIQEGVVAAIAEGFQIAAKSHGWDHKSAMVQAAQAINASKQFPKFTATEVANIRTRVAADRDTFAKDQFDALVGCEGFDSDPIGFVRSYLKAPFGGGNVNLGK